MANEKMPPEGGEVPARALILSENPWRDEAKRRRALKPPRGYKLTCHDCGKVIAFVSERVDDGYPAVRKHREEDGCYCKGFTCGPLQSLAEVPDGQDV